MLEEGQFWYIRCLSVRSVRTCAVSLFLPGGGLCGGEAGGGLGDPGSSFLRVGARSKPFPCGDRGPLPTGEDGS